MTKKDKEAFTSFLGFVSFYLVVILIYIQKYKYIHKTIHITNKKSVSQE